MAEIVEGRSGRSAETNFLGIEPTFRATEKRSFEPTLFAAERLLCFVPQQEQPVLVERSSQLRLTYTR